MFTFWRFLFLIVIRNNFLGQLNIGSTLKFKRYLLIHYIDISPKILSVNIKVYKNTLRWNFNSQTIFFFFMFSDNCQKNLIKKNCSSCGDVCISVDKNLLSNWTNNIIDLLVSAEGVEMFESYLRACNLNESMDRMELWKKSNVILPYRDHRDSEAYVWNRCVCFDIHINLFDFVRGVVLIVVILWFQRLCRQPKENLGTNAIPIIPFQKRKTRTKPEK